MSPEEKMVDRCGGNVSEAARRLGITRNTLRYRLANPKSVLDLHRNKKEERQIKRHNKELLLRVEEAEKRQKVLDALDRPLFVPKIKSQGVKGKREAALVVLASDWHVEEKVFPQQVAGVNEYTTKIAKLRIIRFFEAIVWMAKHHRQSFSIQELVLWFGGDLITGYIHEELEETNGMSPFEAVHFLKGMLIWGILYLLDRGDFDQITIPCSFGNHGRVHKRKRVKTGAQNSFEWAMYVDLEEHFKDDPRVTFVVDKSAHQYVQVYDFRLHFHHGDDVRYGGGVGGVSIPLNKRVAQWDRIMQSDYHHVGHFHQYLDGGRWLVNGSLIGYSEYAMSIGANPEPPQQGCYLLDSKRGKTCVAPLWVDEKGFPKL